MKYYLYLSEEKIEMLFQQLNSASADEREASIGFDWKLLKGSLKEKRETKANYFQKLEQVINELKKLDLVGDVGGDANYISGTLKMRWGTYGFGHPDPLPITFWGYSTYEFPFSGMALALAGSSYHLLGEQKEGGAHSHSLTGNMVNWFLNNLENEFTDEEIEILNKEKDNGHSLDEYDIANGTYLAATQISGQEAKYEFVAKVLHRSHWPEGFRMSDTNKVVLATPLYVALCE